MINIIDILKSSRLWRLVLLLAFVFPMNILPMRMSETGMARAKKFLEKKGFIKQVPQERAVLIFLDDSEEEPLAIGDVFLTALYQEACPIVASTSLLYTLCRETKKDTRSIEVLLDDMVLASSENRVDDFRKKNSIAVRRIGFKEERWIIKKINESLVLLIPKAYLELLQIGSNLVELYYKDLESASDVELQLGLKVNRMETITIEQIDKPKYFEFADYFVEAMDSIFCTKSDYKIVQSNGYEWVIYIDGHGSINTKIAGLGLHNFQQFLNFLEYKIKTQLLMYVSCYAVGVNSDKIFGNMKSKVKVQYSFPIIVSGTNDVPIIDVGPAVDLDLWRTKREIKLHTFRDFTDFVTRVAKKIKEGKYKKLWATGFPQNIPQIKLPGIEWLSVDAAGNEVVTIGSILTTTRDPQKPLDIVSFFKKDPEIILLYTDDIPFELVINSNQLKVILSMMSSGPYSDMPEIVVHRIKKISSTTHDFTGMLRWFILTGLSAGGSKWFCIDEIGDNKDILITGPSKEATKFYYKDRADNLFMAEVKSLVNIKNVTQEPILFNKVEIDSDEEKYYQLNIRIVRESYPQEKLKVGKEEISPEQIKKIEGIYPGARGKQEYEEIEKLYPNLPSWIRSWLIWWKYGK